FPARDKGPFHPLMDQPVLQDAEARQGGTEPGMVRIIDFDAVETLRDARQKPFRRRVGKRELLVGQHQKRLGAAAEKDVDPDSVRLGGELGLHEPKGVRGPAQVAPFYARALSKPDPMPLLKGASELVANRLIMRRDDDDAVLGRQRAGREDQRAKDT